MYEVIRKNSYRDSIISEMLISLLIVECYCQVISECLMERRKPVAKYDLARLLG
mgnify:CR=1 FL=1